MYFENSVRIIQRKLAENLDLEKLIFACFRNQKRHVDFHTKKFPKAQVDE